MGSSIHSNVCKVLSNFAKLADGKAGTPVQMYLDDNLVSSPEIGADLANGVPSTDVQVSGTEQSAAAAQAQAKSIQVVLESGALPVSVSIVGIDSVSADLEASSKPVHLLQDFCTSCYSNYCFH